MNASVPVRTYAAELCGFMRLQSPVAYSVIGIVRTEVSLLGGPITILVRAPCDTLVSCSLCRAFAIRIAYARLFQVPTKTIRISSAINHYSLPADSRSGVVYVGNLGINRIVPLTELGRALRAAAITGFETINVYSGERNSTILQQINKGNGLTYCGCISEREVERLLGTSKFIIFIHCFNSCCF